jgi:hypothetical protein
VRDAHVFRGEVVELVFIGTAWFTADLKYEGGKPRSIMREEGTALQNCTPHLGDEAGKTPGR